MRRIAIVLVLASCMEHGKSPGGDGGVVLPGDGKQEPGPFVNDTDPAHCTKLEFRAVDSVTRTFGPFTLGATTACVHLDGTGAPLSHFLARTRNEPGTQSSFTLLLTLPSGELVKAGEDVTFGLESPQTAASLEQTFDTATVRDLVLLVRTRDELVRATDVTIDYEVPLD